MRYIIMAPSEGIHYSPVGKEFADGRFGAWAFDSREDAERLIDGKQGWFAAGHDEEAQLSVVERLQRHKEGSGLIFVDGGKTTGWFGPTDHRPPEEESGNG